MSEQQSSFISDWLLPSTVKRAVIVGAVVGTLLSLINQWQAIIGGSAPIDWLKVFLTYLVPYGVSSYSTAASLRDNRKS